MLERAAFELKHRGPLKLAASAVRGHCVARRHGRCVLDLAKDNVACGNQCKKRCRRRQANVGPTAMFVLHGVVRHRGAVVHQCIWVREIAGAWTEG